jgi:hypothetical protein
MIVAIVVDLSHRFALVGGSVNNVAKGVISTMKNSNKYRSNQRLFAAGGRSCLDLRLYDVGPESFGV